MLKKLFSCIVFLSLFANIQASACMYEIDNVIEQNNIIFISKFLGKNANNTAHDYQISSIYKGNYAGQTIQIKSIHKNNFGSLNPIDYTPKCGLPFYGNDKNWLIPTEGKEYLIIASEQNGVYSVGSPVGHFMPLEFKNQQTINSIEQKYKRQDLPKQ